MDRDTEKKDKMENPNQLTKIRDNDEKMHKNPKATDKHNTFQDAHF